MWQTIIKMLSINSMGKKVKDNFWTKLIKEDTNVSVMNFFLMCTLGVGVILLAIPAIAMIVDVWFNHTLTINYVYEDLDACDNNSSAEIYPEIKSR